MLVNRTKKLCKQCEKPVLNALSFCSDTCRNLYVSEMMIRKSKKVKKEYGNSYYLKKNEES